MFADPITKGQTLQRLPVGLGAKSVKLQPLLRPESMDMAKAMARHILVKTAQEAEALKERIAKGEAFDTLARKYSSCPSAKKGGDLGEVRPGQLVKSIDQVIFKKPVRMIHGPVKSQFGYHLVHVFFRD